MPTILTAILALLLASIAASAQTTMTVTRSGNVTTYKTHSPDGDTTTTTVTRHSDGLRATTVKTKRESEDTMRYDPPRYR
jgi:hypothetical protein